MARRLAWLGEALALALVGILCASLPLAGAQTTAPAVTLLEPETVHSDGADLEWTRFDSSGGATFTSYEVHRSSSGGFSPSSETLLTTIRDPAITAFGDTTAAPGKSFSYRVVANGSASNEWTASLPAGGEARKTLQPSAEKGEATYVEDTGVASQACVNNGRSAVARVGTTATAKRRSILKFDVRDIPVGATVSDAKLSLSTDSAPIASLTVGAHKVIREWKEGTGSATCTGDGASWTETQGGVAWADAGGSLAPTATDSVAHSAGATGADTFNLTSLAQQWADGSAPNLGVLLKAGDETTVDGKSVGYASDDHVTASKRPKLTVSYKDKRKAKGPTVSVATPDPAIKATGTRDITAATSDDRRVEKVEFLIDGASVATDTTAPFVHSWNTTTYSNGTHRVQLKATDDAGNVSTSPEVSYTVQNSPKPTAKLLAPTGGYLETVKEDAPAGLWRLGEASGGTASDASGQGRDGSYGGGYSLGQAGITTDDADKSAKLQNSSTDGKVSISTLSNMLGQKLSAEAWVAHQGISTTGEGNRVVSRKWGQSGGWKLSLVKTSTGEQRAEWAINDGGTVYTTSSSLSASSTSPVTHHLAGTYDGQDLRLYVDGRQRSSTSRAAAALDNSATVHIGETLSDNLAVDDVALYNDALSSEQVKNHWEMGRGNDFWLEGANELEAEASDDGSVARVEFYADGLLVGEDATAPYTTSWNTQDAARPFYDGTHTLTVKAVDDHNQSSAETAPLGVQVENGFNSKYDAELTSGTVETVFPQAVTYDPAATTQEKHGLEVPVTNESSKDWSQADVVLRSRWVGVDESLPTVTGPDVALGADMPSDASRTAQVMAEPPTLPAGVDSAQYRLQVDAYSKSDSAWFQDRGSTPLEEPVTVYRAKGAGLGLEKFYHYEGEQAGAGMQHLFNVANGNSLLRLTPFQAPGRGLSTVVDLTYNALERKSDSPVGNGFSLSISSLTRFATPLDIHPNKADQIGGRAKRYIDMTDGDGTVHRFESPDGVAWHEPPGVHLYLRKFSDTDPSRAWALTRPDRTTFFYDAEGFPTRVEDRNGNRMLFSYEDTPPGEDPGGPKKRIVAVTDPGGTGPEAAGRTFEVDYYSKAEAKKAHVRGQIQYIKDHTDSTLEFNYYDDGNLRALRQKGGRKADGSRLATRSWIFTYTTSNGDGPAITDPAARQEPESKVSNQSSALYSVRDPKGKETRFSYLGSGNGNDRWKLASRVDRAGATTSYSYDTTNRVTTVNAPLSRTSKYGYDADGKVVKITNPKSEATSVAWSADRHVSRVTEPTGKFSEYLYNANGMPTEQKDQLGNRTLLEYENPAADAGDTSARWKAGRTIPHVSQLVKKTDPRGAASATAGDFEWRFAYDGKGNPTSDTDPEGGTSTRTFLGNGDVADSTDPNGNKTAYGSYDANGIPNRITDAKGGVTQTEHDDDGLLRFTQDPNHASDSGANPREYRSSLDYDAFHRLGRQSAPKSTRYERGQLIWSGADYDENDNVVEEVGPHYGKEYTGPAEDTTRREFDEMDRQTLETGPDTSADASGERTKSEYDAAGRVTKATDPKGVQSGAAGDFETSYDYDPLDRVLKETGSDASGATTKTRRTHYCYDLAGDLRSVTAPKAGVASVTCGTAGASASHTQKIEYDAAHRPLAEVDALGNRTVKTYDADGNVGSETDARGAKTTTEFNGRGQPSKVLEPFEAATSTSGARTLTTKLEYDPAGNLAREISPRGWDASSDKQAFGQFATTYRYDPLNRPVRVDLPTSSADPEAHYVHQAYDANGNLTMTSQPDPQGDGTLLAPDKKTEMTHLDPGWIRTSDAGVEPNVHFDYTAEGWQTLRVPERAAGGGLNSLRQVSSEYYADGQLKEERDREGHPTAYEYDANNNMTKAGDTSGVVSEKESRIDMTAAYDGFDQPTKVREKKQKDANWGATTYAYDLNGNEETRVEDAEEDAGGAQLKAGRRLELAYEANDWLKTQTDRGESSGASDDRRMTRTYFPSGLPRDDVMATSDSAGAYATKQSTVRDYFQNDLPRIMQTKNGAGAVLEGHTLSYHDAAGVYQDGNRTKDVLTRQGPNTAAPCRSSACTQSFGYDARGRVRRADDGHGGITDYKTDAPGNVTEESFTKGGVTSKESASYVGNQLRTRTTGVGTAAQKTTNSFYDAEGNLDCETAQAGTKADCSPAEGTSASANLIADYAFDGKNRMQGYRSFGSGAKSAKYSYDAFDRPTEQTDKSAAGESTKLMSYAGLSDQTASEEHRTGSATGTLKKTKSYSYGPDGERRGMTETPSGGTGKYYGYAHDAHGSTSLLLNEGAQKAQASYGYTPYGEPDADLTKESDPADSTGATPTKPEDPLNSYRFSAKRIDPSSGTLDMGARRYGPQTSRFIQEDVYDDALANLDLATDPLTQNRYALAAGNPVSFIEVDGQ